MRTTIDAAGRIVIPKKLREEAGLQPGMPLEVRCRDGVIEIEPVPVPVKLVWEGEFLVAGPCEDVGTLSAEDVERIREALREEREGKMT